MMPITEMSFQATGISAFQKGKLTLLDINNDFATAQLSLHGGSLLSFIPKQGAFKDTDLLWVSDKAVYHGFKPIRGGIPICWPWFGTPPIPGLPAHGFVRNIEWQVSKTENLASGATRLVLTLISSEETMEIWPFEFTLNLTIDIGKTLALTLTTYNQSQSDLLLTEAFHTYFKVDQVNQVQITGLDGSTKLDKLNNAPAEQQQGAHTVSAPMDDVYLGVTQPLQFTEMGKTISLSTEHARSAVVWNPGLEKVVDFYDINDADWPGFICIETGNVLTDVVSLKAGQQHTCQLSLVPE